MTDVLAMCSHWPLLHVAKGEVLIEEGAHADRLFVLRTGAFDIVRGGIRVVRVKGAGAFLGEMSAVLGSAPTASVLAAEDSTVHVMEGASAAVRAHPELIHAIARLLAQRLSAVTAYLVDIKRQYADSDTHLALMDQVLANVISMNPQATPLGSERKDVPDY